MKPLGPKRKVTGRRELAWRGAFVFALACGHEAFRVPMGRRSVSPRHVRCLACFCEGRGD